MKQTTKEKILEGSRLFFNEYGFGASSLYQISQSIGISRGNLTYHFKDKDAILEIHLDEMEQKANRSFSQSFMMPSWETLRKTSKDFLQVQTDYAYIFFDKNLVLQNRVQKRIKAIRENHIRIQMAMINISIQSGNMKKEPIPGVYHNLSRTLWQIIFFYLVSRNFKETNEVSWDKQMWSLLLPHFTKKGIASFVHHFGDEYYNSLGLQYSSFMKEVSSF